MADQSSSYFRLTEGARLPEGPRLHEGEQLLWHGRASVAEHLYSETMTRSAVRWTLPPSTTVMVTDRRLIFVGPMERENAAERGRVWSHRAWIRRRDHQTMVGQLLYQWPYHLYVHSTQEVLLVCGAALAGGRPTLAISGGDVGGGFLANILRRAISGFRIQHSDVLGLNETKIETLTGLLNGPNFQRKVGSVRLPGALLLGFQQEREYADAALAAVHRSRATH
ncbi:hypothetical protein ACIA8K_23790 [Catenuloplanes sp. NPDC051500]|uniref:hypothetical protein n=1 Tax=Catenuloplanes sp. NPDC051500 TaxID=3363959 RepID=UPI0037B16D58